MQSMLLYFYPKGLCVGGCVLWTLPLHCWSLVLFFMLTTVLFVPCGGRKKSPRTCNQCYYIFIHKGWCVGGCVLWTLPLSCWSLFLFFKVSYIETYRLLKIRKVVINLKQWKQQLYTMYVIWRLQVRFITFSLSLMCTNSKKLSFYIIVLFLILLSDHICSNIHLGC
jgi:hypothetical protein